jgi:hypothetical protein
MTTNRSARGHKSLLCSAAVLESWARTPNRAARTKPGMDGLLARFEREVDPAGELDPADRRLRAEQMRTAHMRRLAARSARVRAERRST